ncbi:AAC(3) family N-acetyltransferase [Polynucleobacter sp. MWH-Spelu-300-X4]|uniref:AAC(3) family N-acetyltransferase n=1 Tax=Polynucleobacter sp. MWH-Spelu-300-X4 TaxID=2689109 RepID=UPI001BFE2838|nr:AAC(3) family N-acetyltransferase [Polynucleobacter sp. MWH-Spelu-300-X4]QWD80048.1 AAC(3) family N-acetyltransferase [Polynucleobacter sp. MWH-Spelu-300-X4]
MIKNILSFSPILEFFLRLILRKFNIFNRYFFKIKKYLSSDKSKKYNSTKIDELMDLISINLSDSNSVLIHSSSTELQKIGISPNVFVDKLINLVGPKGTVFAPAIPIIKNKEFKFTKKNNIDENIYEYNINKTPTGTGLISKILLKIPNSVRSNIPINAMVGVGHYADKVIQKNIKDIIYPCGINSGWYFCYSIDATIIFLGVDPTHSMTMIHVVEDSFPDEWPVNNWYGIKNFRVKDSDSTYLIRIYERLPYWSIRYSERNLKRVLLRNGILKHKNINGLNLYFCKSKDLINFLKNNNKNGYPYYIFPWEKKF